VEFDGGQGDALAARLDEPGGRPRAYAIFAHCFTCTKDSHAASRISSALAAQGIAVLRFDFTGIGSSAGDFSQTDFSSNVLDLVRAAEWLRAHRAAPMLLVGHSLGGAAVLAAAARIPEVKAVATLNAPSDPAHLEHLLDSAADVIEREGVSEVDVAGRPFCIRREFLEDLREQRLLEQVAELDRALLVMHGPLDTTVGIDNARALFQAAKHPKSFVSLDDADHLLSRKADSDYAASVLAAWADRYVTPSEPPPPELDADGRLVAEADVTVGELDAGRFVQEVLTGAHRLLADEPPAVGGDDLGPSPYQLLLAGLGACTSMTLRMYADRKGWPLEDVRVYLSHDKIHAMDCAECESVKGKVDCIDRVVELRGDLDEEQVERLLQIADRCPVHLTLHNEVHVETRGYLDND
jgi:putative redox protein